MSRFCNRSCTKMFTMNNRKMNKHHPPSTNINNINGLLYMAYVEHDHCGESEHVCIQATKPIGLDEAGV